MGSIDTPTFLRDKMKQSQSTVKPVEDSGIDIPDFLKKKEKTGSSNGVTPSDNGLSDIPKVERVKEVLPIGQLPYVKDSLSKFGIKAPVIPKEQQVNQPVSTEVVQPKITASYDDFVAHNEERVAKKKELKKEAVANAAMKVLKNKGVIKPEEEGKALNLSQFSQLNTEKQRLQEALDNGDATFAISKDGELGLKKTIGFWDALTKGWNSATKANDDAANFYEMDAAQKVDFLHQQQVEQEKIIPSEYLGERPSSVGSIGQLAGENAPFLGKAVAGTLTGTALVMAAPETAGASLAGLPAAMGFIFTAEDSKNQGIYQEVTRRFYQLKQENPEADEVELMKQAEEGTLIGGMAGILTNAALMTSIKTPLSNVAKGVVGKSITKAVGNAVYGGAAVATIEGAKLAEGNLEGIKATPTEIAKEMGTVFSETATTLGLLHVMTGSVTGALKLPNIVKSAFKYALKDAKPTELKATLEANEKAGTIHEGTTERVMADLDEYKAALAKAPNGLSPEAEASVAGLIQAKNKLIAEMKTKDDTAKPFYEEKIEGINEQIQKIVNTGKPYAFEVDEVSGEKYTEPKPEEKPSIVVEPPRSFPEPITIGGTEEIKPSENGTIKEANIENKQGDIKTETEKPNIEPVSEIIEPTTETTGGSKEPPIVEPVTTEEGKLGNKALATRLVGAKNIPEAAKKGIEAEGLEYEPQSQKEAHDLAKSIIDEVGIDEAVLNAQAQKFGGDVNTLVQTEALDRLARLSFNEVDPKIKLEHDLKFAEIGIALDKQLRKQGQGISALNLFYKKSPLGIKLMENTKRKEDFEKWSKPKEQSWKEAFDDMMKEPEFETIVKEQVSEGMKKERAESRAKRIKKVDDFFDDAIKKFNSGGATYSSFIPVTPKVAQIALEGMRKAYHAGEKVAKVIEDAVAYISKEIGSGWNKEAFVKEWEEKLKDKEEKKPLTDEELKQRLLTKFSKKLKGLSDRQKEDVVIKAHKKIIESGGLDYAEFRDIIAKVTGRGEMTDAEAAKLVELVDKTNKVDDAQKKAIEERTPEAIKSYDETLLEASKASRELNTLLYTRPNITKRITSMMQLNTLGIASLVANPVYNIWNQVTLRAPIGLIKTMIDKGIYQGAKLFGKEVLPETDVLSLRVQREFFNKLGLGTREAVGQFVTGLNRLDYTQKEIYGQQIRPATSIQDLWAFHKGEKNLTKKQVFDKLLQASPQGVTAEIIARTLNLGDKPQRFSAEGAQASAFAKSLGLKDIDYKLFIKFPREEAFRVYKAKGLSDVEAGKKADYVQDTIIKEGERSTFQQDNFLNDVLNKIFGGKESGTGGLIKSVAVSPYIKIPSNAYWSYFNLVNPEVALLQSMVYGAKAAAKKFGDAKFSFDKRNSSASKDLNEAKYWFAHAAVGIATRAVITAMVTAGVYRAGNTEKDTKKEREGEAFYEPQGTINYTKLWAWIRGEDASKIKGGLVVPNKWFGHWGTVGNTIAKRMEDMTPEQKEKQEEYLDMVLGNLKESSLKELEQGIFGNTSSLLNSLNQGGDGLKYWGLNTINMFTNIVHPAAYAQVSKAQLPYYSKIKADTFMGELKNSMLQRSSVVRAISDQYPPSKIGIWGDRLEKKDNIILKLFGMSKTNDDNFAQPIYEDYVRTNNTKFFPSAVMPRIEDGGITTKLNAEETAKLEQYVGRARKDAISKYVNDMATFVGSDKTYKQLTDEEKVNNLQIIYDLGYEAGKFQFLKNYPQYKAVEPSEETTEKKTEKEQNNKQLRQEIKEKLNIEQ